MNIGFSKSKQLNKNQRRRLEMNNFSKETSVDSSTTKFGASANRNRIKSSLTVIKPRNKSSFPVTVPEISEEPKIISNNIDVNEKIIPETVAISAPLTEIIVEKKLPEVIPQRLSDIVSKTIQVGFLNLNELENYCRLNKNNDLPLWQLTAFDPQTGGAWIGYSYEIAWDNQKEFLEVLSKHLYSNNILPEQINFKVNYDSAILNILRQADTEKSEEYLDQYFAGRVIVRNGLSERDSELNRFHYLLEDNFYNAVKISSVSKLLEKAESFLIRYNYKENYNSSLNLPPNQLICRQYGGDFGPELLKFKPILFKKNRASTARYLIGLKMMAGLFTSMAGSVISRKNRVKRIGKIGITDPIQKANTIKTELPKPLPPKTRIKTTEKQFQDSKSIENKFEYISLNKMNWEKPEGRQIENDSRTGIGRNRKELINRAKELLAQKRSIAELKKTLPMTEGELSMLSQNIMISDKERNIQ